MYCPTRILGTGWPVLELYPPKSWLFRSQKMKFWPVRTADYCYCSKISKYQAQLQLAFFSAQNFVTQSRLSRTTGDPTRLIRPRPIDCDRVCEQPVKPGFCPYFFQRFPRVLLFLFEHRQKHFYRLPDLVTIYTPKEARSWSFVAWGVNFCAT